MAVSIRPAKDHDIEALCEMYYDFHEFHVCGVPTHLRSLGNKAQWDQASLREVLGKIMQGDESEIFVAETAGKLAGLFSRSTSRDLYNISRILARSDLGQEKLRLGFVACGAMSSRRDWRTVSVDDVAVSSAVTSGQEPDPGIGIAVSDLGKLTPDGVYKSHWLPGRDVLGWIGTVFFWSLRSTCRDVASGLCMGGFRQWSS